MLPAGPFASGGFYRYGRHLHVEIVIDADSRDSIRRQPGLADGGDLFSVDAELYCVAGDLRGEIIFRFSGSISLWHIGARSPLDYITSRGALANFDSEL